MERAILLADGEVLTLDALAVQNPQSYDGDSFVIRFNEKGMGLNEINKRLIEKVLQFTSGNQEKAAHILNVPRSTLRHKIQKYKVHIQSR